MADDIRISFRMEGSQGRPKVVPVWVPAGTTLGDCSLYAVAMTTVLEAVSDAYVQKASVEFPIDVSGATKGAPDGTQWTHYGARVLHDTVGRYSHGTWIPAFKPAFLADNNVISALEISSLDAAFRVGLGGVAPTDGNGNDLTAYLGGKRAHRK